MDKLIQILKDLEVQYEFKRNSIMVGKKRMYVVGQDVYFSYPNSESKLSINNPMLKSWIRYYVGGVLGNAKTKRDTRLL